MSALDRSYWLAVVLSAYISAASVQNGGLSWTRAAAAAGVPLIWAWLWRRTRLGRTESEDSHTLRAARLAATGSGFWLIARLGAPQIAALEVAATLGLGVTASAATYALARLPAAPGLLRPPASSRSVDATVFTAMLWTVALVVATARFVAPGAVRLDPLTLDYATTAASIGSLLVLVAATWRLRFVRRLELGVGARAAGALVVTITSLAVAVPTAAADIAPPDRVLPVAVLTAALGTLWCVLLEDARRIAAALRATLVMVVLGVPTALLTGALAQQQPADAGTIGLIGSAVAVLVGLVTRTAARPLGPEQSRWLDAVARASENALVPEPQQAVIATLTALKATSASPVAKPQLWLLEPPTVQSVDVAGYLHEESAEAPPALCELAQQEPELTLRAEVLAAVQVRRPEVRPLLDWFQVRAAFSATVVTDGDGPLGFLLLPRGDRTSALTLEEARAVRRLTERLSALLAVTSALSRSRVREAHALKKARFFEQECQRVAAVLEGEGERHLGHASALAEPVLGAAYSPAARLTLSSLRNAATQAQSQRAPTLVLLCPAGTAPDPWAAATHLAVAGGKGPFLIVEGCLEERHSKSRWDDIVTSPLGLTAGGTLLIKDLDLVPVDRQDQIADLLTRAHTQPKAPGGMAEGGQPLAAPLLMFSVSAPLELLLQQGRLSHALDTLLGRPVVALPSLAERPEDLRAMILDVLGRSPNRPDGAPLGIGRRALQLLMDHTWPGNDLELRDLLTRAALLASGPQLSAEDLNAAGFLPPTSFALASTATSDDSLPPPSDRTTSLRRRPRATRSRRPKR